MPPKKKANKKLSKPIALYQNDIDYVMARTRKIGAQENRTVSFSEYIERLIIKDGMENARLARSKNIDFEGKLAKALQQIEDEVSEEIRRRRAS